MSESEPDPEQQPAAVSRDNTLESSSLSQSPSRMTLRKRRLSAAGLGENTESPARPRSQSTSRNTLPQEAQLEEGNPRTRLAVDDLHSDDDARNEYSQIFSSITSGTECSSNDEDDDYEEA